MELNPLELPHAECNHVLNCVAMSERETSARNSSCGRSRRSSPGLVSGGVHGS